MGVVQDVLHFGNSTTSNSSHSASQGANDYFQQEQPINEYGMVEITPPELISALITENGIMTPNAVSEELIKLWF
jgi:translation initiation factor 2B subunit (eIF-2B alpha/beta/delta family)